MAARAHVVASARTVAVGREASKSRAPAVAAWHIVELTGLVVRPSVPQAGNTGGRGPGDLPGRPRNTVARVDSGGWLPVMPLCLYPYQ